MIIKNKMFKPTLKRSICMQMNTTRSTILSIGNDRNLRCFSQSISNRNESFTSYNDFIAKNPQAFTHEHAEHRFTAKFPNNDLAVLEYRELDGAIHEFHHVHVPESYKGKVSFIMTHT